MAHPFNPLNPMNHSMYLESEIPTSIDEAIASIPSVPTYVNPNGPKLRPQPTKDSWYYNKDNLDDGQISTFEKLKAFAKGGTYNMVRGMFCDNNGFSLGRTLATAAGITAVALTGPIGVAIASGVGLIAAVDNFKQSMRKAKTCTTDQQAREAFEGFGESTTTAGLSLFGGFKGLQAIKKNFAFAKANPDAGITLKNKLLKWDVSKGIKPNAEPPKPIEENPPQPKPVEEVQPIPVEEVQPTPVNTPSKPVYYEPNVSVSEIDARGYVPDWKPVGELPKGTRHPYFKESTPIGEIPKPVVESPSQVNYVPDWKPIEKLPNPTKHPYFKESTVIENISTPKTPQPPKYDFNYGTDSNHFFG